MKLTYWFARIKRDAKCYSIRARTKREAVAELNSGRFDPNDFEPVKKITIEYADGFDLLDQCSAEGGLGQED